MSNKVPKQQPSLHQRAVDRADAARAAQAAAEAKRRRNVWILVGVVATVVVVSIVTAIVLNAGSSDDAAAVPSGLARELGCASCHTANGDRSEGPTWKDLAGSEVVLTDGSVVVADDAYLRRSILEPALEVRQGFTPSMPAIDLTEEQLDALVVEIQALGEG